MYASFVDIKLFIIRGKTGLLRQYWANLWHKIPIFRGKVDESWRFMQIIMNKWYPGPAGKWIICVRPKSTTRKLRTVPLCQEPVPDQADGLATKPPITILPDLSFPGMDLSRYHNFVLNIFIMYRFNFSHINDYLYWTSSFIEWNTDIFRDFLTYCTVLLLYNGPRRWGDGDGAREPAQQGRERGDIVKLEDSQPEITLDFLQHKDLI